MTITPIDITDWQPLEESALGSFYSEGSLSKHLLEYDGSYYLFKETWTRSRQNRYFDEVKHQFWSEIIAAFIAKEMGLIVPDTFIGINNSSKISFKVGVLNKWFLSKKDSFAKGSEILTSHIEDYSEKEHNLDSAIQFTSHIENSLNYWMKLMFFDALIGNTDRHHENWGVINRSQLSPLYDNGISLGWRIEENEFSSDVIERQMRRFKFKMKVSSTDEDRSVSGVVDYFLASGRITRMDMNMFISEFNPTSLRLLKERLCSIDIIPDGYALSPSRFDFIYDFVCYRANALKRMIEE